MEEKKIARREYFSSLPLISSKASSVASSLLKAWTTFWLPIISLIRLVCSPLVSDCSLNILKVFFAIKLATNRETGVITTTTTVIPTFTESIKNKVPMIVTTPVNSWVNPISRPSANWSTSATTRLTISPCEWPSRYFRGSSWILQNAFSLISWIIL